MAYHLSGAQFHTVLNYDYSAGNLIGHGAFALVYKGRRKQTLETVAIKKISLKAVPSHLSTIRQKEITILKEVKHSNVVQLYDYHEDQAYIYLMMEYCNGGDLGDYLQTKKTLSEHSIRHLANHIANSLSALHKLHIIHRDIKPQNLLLSYPLTGSGGTGKRTCTITDATIKLADFGFARYLTGTDMAATLCGSPLYMAPEILLGEKYDSKADLWSVGTILYQCLAGTAPFVAANPHALRRRYEREKLVAKIPEGTSRYLASLLTKLLKKNRHERLSHEELCAHPFLADPSIQASGYLVMDPQPPRAKSSPVPIKRHTPSPSPSPSPYNTSRRLSGSPRQSPYEVFVSPSSGPPSIHPVGSASSLARQQSPHSDITDHGFIIVDSPRCSSSPHSSAASSPQSGSYNSCRSHTPSSTGHTPSSSYGSSSMQKFRSLNTPFYKAPPTSCSSNGSTPSEANSPPTQWDQYYQRPQSHSNSSKRRSSEPCATLLSHTPPFARLTELGMLPTTAPSPYISPHSRQASSSPSPSSLTAHSPSSQPHTLTAPGVSAVAVAGRLPSRSSMRYSLSAHGSGSKLSSLTEQTELESQTKGHSDEKKRERGEGSGTIAANKRSFPISSHRESGARLEQLITTSQVLCSDEDEEEVNFPLSLSLQSSQSSNKTEEQEMAEVEEGGSGDRWSQIEVTTPTCPARSARNQQRCKSAGHGAVECNNGFFSRQHSETLSENFHQINSRAASLSTHHSLLESDSSVTTPTTINQYKFQVSPAAEIKPMNPAFLLPSSPPNSRDPGKNSMGSGVVEISDGDLHSSHSTESEGSEGRDEVTVCLDPLRQAMSLAWELVGMAQARQGPIMLLSTDLSLSGGVSQSERYSEQLVLYAKAVSVLDSGLRQFQIEMATSSMESDQALRTAEVEAGELQESCLEKARQIREGIEKERGRHHSHTSRYHPSHSHPSLLSAERLLLIEALDMCKHAILNEQTGDSKECVKRYRIAKLIFCHLLSDSKTHRDRTVLNSYVHSVTKRIQRLTSDS